MSTVPGLWAMPCSAQSFSSQSAPRRPVAMTTCLPSTSRGPVFSRRITPLHTEPSRMMFSHSVSKSISTPAACRWFWMFR